MAKLLEIYQHLKNISDPSVDMAMIAALPTADPVAAALIAASLLERRLPDGLLCLVLNYHNLPPEAQELVLAQSSELYHALRVAAEAKEGPGPANVAQIVQRAGAVRLAYILVDLLRYGSPEVRQQAAACFLELAQQWNSNVAASHDPTGAAALLQALQESLTIYRHHNQVDVLRAILALSPRAMPGILRVFQDRSNPAVDPMAKLLEDDQDPLLRRSLLMWARVGPLTDSAISAIQETPVGEMSGILEAAYLLPIGNVQRSLRRLPDPQLLCPLPDQVSGLSSIAQRAIPRWIMSLPLDPQEQVDALARLSRIPDRFTRLAALRQLMTLSDRGDAPSANDVISSFCSDSELVLARIALRHLVRRRWAGLPKLLLTLVNSPHEEIQQLAGGHLAPLGFTKFWEAWPRLSYAQQLAGGQALIKIDPNFHRQLGDRIVRLERGSRLRALAMIWTLNQGAFFEQALIVLARDRDEMVASSAVRALGSAQSPVAVEALELALRHADARVRANAVESLQQMNSTRHVQRLLEMARNEESRPRANAILALMAMRPDEAMAAVTDMLADHRQAQRISALWLVDYLGLVDFARQVAEMSISDPDVKVKNRAANVIQRMMRTLSSPVTSEGTITPDLSPAPGPKQP